MQPPQFDAALMVEIGLPACHALCTAAEWGWLLDRFFTAEGC